MDYNYELKEENVMRLQKRIEVIESQMNNLAEEFQKLLYNFNLTVSDGK